MKENLKEKLKEKLKEFACASWTASEKTLLVADVLLVGILIGWLTSPFRRKTGRFCNNVYGPQAADPKSSGIEEEEEEA